jgi:hypothetical protein
MKTTTNKEQQFIIGLGIIALIFFAIYPPWRKSSAIHQLLKWKFPWVCIFLGGAPQLENSESKWIGAKTDKARLIYLQLCKAGMSLEQAGEAMDTDLYPEPETSDEAAEDPEW